MQLGELIEKMTTSDRLVIINAAGQVIYRGYAANFAHGTINPLRRVKRFVQEMTNRETLWAGYGNVQAHRKDVGLGKHTGTAGADTS